MMRWLSILALCCVLVGCHRTFGIPTESVQDLTALASVKTIYVENLSHGEDPLLVEGSDLVKEKILARLSGSTRFSVVDTPEKADALLTGVAGFQRWYFGMESFYGLEGSLNTQYSGIGIVRMLCTKTRQPIWTHQYQTGLLYPTQSVADRVADQITEKLLRDAKSSENQ